MPQDPFQRVQVFLSETRANPLALLLDLTTLLPEDLLRRAIWLAQHAGEDALRAFLIHALAKRLPTRVERIELAKQYPVPEGTQIEEVSVPEGKEAKRLIGQLSEQQRYQAFDQILRNAASETGAPEWKDHYGVPDDAVLKGDYRGRREGGDEAGGATKSVEDESGGFEAFEPPEGAGGGGGFSFAGEPADTGGGGDFEFSGGAGSAASDAGYESANGGGQKTDGDDDGGGFEAFEPPPPAEPQPTAAPIEEPERPDLVNLGFSQ